MHTNNSHFEADFVALTSPISYKHEDVLSEVMLTSTIMLKLLILVVLRCYRIN